MMTSIEALPFSRLNLGQWRRWTWLWLLLLLGPAASAQTWTNNVIDYGDGSANVFSQAQVGPDGKFYVFWKDGALFNSTTQARPRYKLIRWEPTTSSWTNLSTIMADTATFPGIYTDTFQILGDRFGFKVDSQGRYHVLLHIYFTAGEAMVYGFSTNGTSWTFTTLETDGNVTNYSLSDPVLDVDSNDRPRAVFLVTDNSGVAASRPTRIRYYAYDGSSWTGETAYSRVGSSFAINSSVGFGIDSADKAHLAIAVESNGSGTDASLYYLTKPASGSWSSPTDLATGATNAAACSEVAMAIDAADKVHLVRRDNSYRLFYHTDKSGSWVGGQINGTLQGTIDKGLAVNPTGDLFLLQNARTNATNLGAARYAYLFSGETTWQTGAVMTGNSRTAQYITAALDSNRVMMATFDHFTGSGSPAYATPDNPRQLQYATATMPPPGPAAPTVGSPASSSVTQTTATLGGTVSSDGGGTVTARGVVYSVTSVNSNPELGGTGVAVLSASGTTGAFTVSATGLSDGTGYSFKAYASNSVGVAYSAVGTFTTLVDLAPAVTSVSVPANGIYVAGQALDFTLNFDESVNVSGTPTLALTIGGTSRSAGYVSGGGSTALLFRYTVQTGEQDTDGVTIGTLSLAGGSLTDSGDNDAVLTLNSVGSTTGVLVDAVVPTVTGVTVPANGTYRVGQNLEFTVGYSEAVTVVGTPQVGLTVGSTSRNADYVSGSGTTSLLFRYTVASGDEDTNGVAVASAVTANGGTIRDGATNNAVATLNSVGTTTGVLVDGVLPTIVSIARKTPTAQTVATNGVVFAVTFSEAVSNVGTSLFSVVPVNGATVTGTVTGVTGGPVVYDVAVSVSSGTGEFRLNAGLPD